MTISQVSLTAYTNDVWRLVLLLAFAALIAIPLISAPAAAGDYSYILEQPDKTTDEKLAEFAAALGWQDEYATYQMEMMEYEMQVAAKEAETEVARVQANELAQTFGLETTALTDAAKTAEAEEIAPPYTEEEIAALDAASAAYYDAFAANYIATAAFIGSGSGTAEDPYIITNRAQLEAMADDLTAYYQLGNNINLGGSGSPWTPVGSSSAPFAGSLDGDGYTIQNIYISSPDYNQGLFGIWQGDGLYIKNLGVSGTIDSPSAKYCGLIIGWAKVTNSQLSRCWATGIVSGDQQIGGLVGLYGFPTIGSVQATADIPAMENCYFSGSVSGGYSSGGLVGQISSQVSNCYSDGTLTILPSAHGRNGGLVGTVNIIGFVSIPNTISSTVALQTSISGTSPAYGRVWGAAYSYSSATSYTQISTISGATTYANAAMLVNGNTVSGGTTTNKNGADVSASTYHTQTFWQNTLGWDFDTVWYWDDAEQLPKLRAFLHVPTSVTASAAPTTGGVTTEITLTGTATDATAYQWQYSTDSGSTWADITGATTLTAAWTPGATDSYLVRLAASNAADTTYSDPVTVTIYDAPVISASVTPLSGQMPLTVTYTADATDTTTYQWQYRYGTSGNWQNLPAGSSGTYTFTDIGSVQMQVTATGIGGTTTSDLITITVEPPVPEITTATISPQTGVAPFDIHLTGAATNNPEYQWQQQIDGRWITVATGATATYTIPADTPVGNLLFRLYVENQYGSATSHTITIYVDTPPVITITSPRPNAGYTQNTTITVSADISANTDQFRWDFGTGGVGNTQTNPTTVRYDEYGKKTIKLIASNEHGTTEKTVTITISARDARPVVGQTVVPVNTAGFREFMQNMAPDDGGAPNIEGMITSAAKPYTDQIGAFFYVILFGIPYLILWLRQKNLIVPSIIGILFGAWMLVKVPAAYTMPAVAVLAFIVAGGLYGLYVKRP